MFWPIGWAEPVTKQGRSRKYQRETVRNRKNSRIPKTINLRHQKWWSKTKNAHTRPCIHSVSAGRIGTCNDLSSAIALRLDTGRIMNGKPSRMGNPPGLPCRWGASSMSSGRSSGKLTPLRRHSALCCCQHLGGESCSQAGGGSQSDKIGPSMDAVTTNLCHSARS